MWGSESDATPPFLSSQLLTPNLSYPSGATFTCTRRVIGLHNLKEENVIGVGYSGKVYKVILPNGHAVAVKKIQNIRRLKNEQGDEEEENKIVDVEVDTMGLIRHKNILKLLYCISSEEADFKLLVYEFMPNGSLFDRLHGGSGSETVLQWPIRYQIALGAARGLSYLHHDCSPSISHRDVKSSNILLDGDFVPKISDFGVCRVLDSLGDDYPVSSYVGLHGYIAPEYVERVKVNEKSDIYSFSVVLLEFQPLGNLFTSRISRLEK